MLSRPRSIAPFPPASPAVRLRLRRRPRGPGIVLSVVVHGLIILLLVRHGAAVMASGGGGRGARGGGQGGVQFFTLPPAPAMASVELPPPPTIVPPEVPLPDQLEVDVAPVEVTPIPPTMSPSPFAAEQGGGGGGGSGNGAGAGMGAGPGQGDDEGYAFSPNPRGVIVPPENPPKGVRGRPYRVQFWVTAAGRVERIAVAPPIADAKYGREFRERMLSYRFYPAKARDGHPVAGVVVITITP